MCVPVCVGGGGGGGGRGRGGGEYACWIGSYYSTLSSQVISNFVSILGD